jgi:adenosine deaminase
VCALLVGCVTSSHRQVISDLDNSKYQHAEWRISVYGRKPVEWDLLAGWVCNNQLFSDNMLWLIQLPRLYNVYKDTGIIDNFQQMLDNLFVPLFEVTRDPASHPQLHIFLSHVSDRHHSLLSANAPELFRPSRERQSARLLYPYTLTNVKLYFKCNSACP